MINFKKLAALGLAGVMGVSTLAGCGAGANSNSGTEKASVETESVDKASVETKHHKISVGLYTDHGRAVEAINAYLDGIDDVIDVEFNTFVLSTYDENANLTAVQNEISAGAEAIIMTADMGTEAILKECESANVYVAGFLNDYNMSFYTAKEAVFNNEYFLGSVVDGPLDNKGYAEAVAADVIENGYKHVGIATFPVWAYPLQQDLANAFIAKIDEYNKTAEEKIEVYDIAEVDFGSGLPATYFTDHPDMDCLFSVAAGASLVYPKMISDNRTNIALYTTGFEATEDVENFRSSGNGIFKAIACSAPEAIAYPICLIIDKLNGTTYSDLPVEKERVDCAAYQIISDEEMEQMKKTLYYTADYKDAAITGEDILNMCASYNPEATYAGLKAKLLDLGI